MSINFNFNSDLVTTSSGILSFGDTGGVLLTTGTTSNRPSVTGNNGLIRYNTTTNRLEAVINGSYTNLTIASDIAGQYLPLAGGTLTGSLSLPSGTAGSPSLTFSSDSLTGAFLLGTSTLSLSTAGASRLTIDGSGYVLVGATSNTTYNFGSTTYASHIFRGSGKDVVTIQGTNSSVGTALDFANQNNVSNQFRYAQVAALVSTSTAGAEAGAITLSTANSGTLAERVRIDASGQMGIGRTPTALLDVYGTASSSNIRSLVTNSATGGTTTADSMIATGTSNSYIQTTVTDGTSGSVNFGSALATATINVMGSSVLSIKTSNTERARISNGGNVLVGTATQLDGALLTVNGYVSSTTPSAGDNTTRTATTAFVQAALGSAVPTGTLLMWSASSAPSGYMECNGSAISRTTYSALFAIIGILYGSGDGSTTFNIPDFRGYFARGWDNSRGIDSGRALGSTQTDANLAHNHTITDPGHYHGTLSTRAASNGLDEVRADNFGAGNSLETSGSYTRNTSSATTGITINNSGSTEARPKNIAIMFIIKT